MQFRTTAFAAVLGLALVSAACPGALAQDRTNEPPRGFVALFNGTDLTNWHGMRQIDPHKLAAMSEEERSRLLTTDTADAKAHWSVQDGELVNDGHGAYLTTDKEFGDIELLIDYKTVPKADSGIYLRGTPQVQIWDSTKDGPSVSRGAAKGSGGLFNNRLDSPGRDPLVLADKPFGEWNRLRIIQTGARTTVYLNDKLVVDHALMENFWDKERKEPLYARGPIQLQTHGGEIRWRNVFIREIPADEANGILASHGAQGFQPVFDGKSLAGWSGAVDNYEVVDGAIRCKAGKGGVLHTDKEYADFVARLEFRLPPGGNNGLAIRYPGKGDAAYNAMCELQILDDGHQKYTRLDPRQAHGSVYGMIPAKRGYLRPVGEWNFQEVTVKGPRIKVELNGTVILDGDVSQVTEFMGDRPHPGKDRTSGSFGFAGHNDPVEIRDIEIKPLP
jgi:hypothetical protein